MLEHHRVVDNTTQLAGDLYCVAEQRNDLGCTTCVMSVTRSSINCISYVIKYHGCMLLLQFIFD